jgi:hypothetical protein
MAGILATAAMIAALALAALAPGATSSPSGLRYPSSVKSSFVKGCVNGGGSKAACKCVLRKMERRYSYKQFRRIIRRADDTGEFPPAVDRMIESCARRYQ